MSEIAKLSILQTIGTDPGELSAQEFIQQLDAVPDDVGEIWVTINSDGGQIFDGFAIAESLMQHPAKVVTRVIGGAMSIASVIAMAGDERLIAENGTIMIHDPMMPAFGGPSEMRQTAEIIDKMADQIVRAYAEKTRLDADEIRQMMEKETWMDADEAVEMGFATGKLQRNAAIGAINARRYENMPLKIYNQIEAAKQSAEKSKSTNDKELEMSVADRVKEIKDRCDGAPHEFILKHLEAETPVDQVVSEFNQFLRNQSTEQEEQIKMLKDQLAAMEEKIAEMEQEPTGQDEDEGEEVEIDAEGDKEKMTNPAPRSQRLKPRRMTAGARRNQGMTATEQWTRSVAEKMDQGMTRQRAVSMTNRQNPGLREAMINESIVNAARGIETRIQKGGVLQRVS